jgi:hypothetical protein
MINVRASHNIFPYAEVTNLTGICAEHRMTTPQRLSWSPNSRRCKTWSSRWRTSCCAERDADDRLTPYAATMESCALDQAL